MITAFLAFTALQKILIILGVFTGIVQLFILLGMAIHGRVVTLWWGVLSVVFFIMLVLT